MLSLASPSKASAIAARACLVVATAGSGRPIMPATGAAPRLVITLPPGANRRRMLAQADACA